MDQIEDPVFKNSPSYMKSLIGKEVEIKTINKEYKGIVYVIDPIFKTVVLHYNRKSDTVFETVLILYHAIQSLTVLSEDVNEKYLLTPEQTQSLNAERKGTVKKWLQHMQINVEESGDYLKIDDHLLILPPYGIQNCVSNNTIILERIQNILESMPQTFNG